MWCIRHCDKALLSNRVFITPDMVCRTLGVEACGHPVADQLCRVVSHTTWCVACGEEGVCIHKRERQLQWTVNPVTSL